MARKPNPPVFHLRKITMGGGLEVPPDYVPADIYLLPLVDHLVSTYGRKKGKQVGTSEMP